MKPRFTVDVCASRGFGQHAGLLRKIGRSVLRVCCQGSAELSVALVDDVEMRRLNASFRGKDRPTDVLAFSQREGAPGAEQAAGLLGDVVISVPTAARQAERRRTGLDRELAELLVHGVLHLLGYDHERSPADARRMFRRSREVLAWLESQDLVLPPARPKRLVNHRLRPLSASR